MYSFRQKFWVDVLHSFISVSHFLTRSFIFPESKEEEREELVSNIPTKGNERSREVDPKVVAYIVANTTSGWRN